MPRKTISADKSPVKMESDAITVHASEHSLSPSPVKTMPIVEGPSTSAPAPPSAADLFTWLEKSRKATRQEPQLQTFSRERVRNWFTVAEKQFKSAQIDNQHDMFNLVCAALDPATTDKVLDVIETLHMKNRYNIFKAALIDRFAPSSRQQTRKLLQGMKLDNRPGHLFGAITKHSRNEPENVHETAGTISAMAHFPTIRDDLHPNVTTAVRETGMPDSRHGYCRRRNEIQLPPLHTRPPNR